MSGAERMGGYAARLEAERFVGRRDVLALVDDVVGRRRPQRIVYVHGPGGVGKSALLRAIATSAEQAGRPVVRVDGRLVAPTREALRAAAAPADQDGAVLVVDEVDEVAAMRVELRDAVLDVVPASGVVVVAGRQAPDRAWFDGELQVLTTAVALRPLERDDARQLLARRGVVDAQEVDRLVHWAAGFPLALTLAASLASGEASGAPTSAAGPTASLDALLLERLGGRELVGVDPDVLDVASIAPAVDGPLLAAVLPGRPTRQGYGSLRELSIAEPLGLRTTLHPLARSAVRTRLRDSDPDRHRTLVLRIAAHLHRRAREGDPVAALELGSLVEDPELRLGAERSTAFYADLPRAGDVDALSVATGAGSARWFTRFARWCEERPGQAIAVRRVDGTLSGMSVICMASAMPPWAEEQIETGPVLRWLRDRGLLDVAALTHDTIILEEPGDAAVRAEVIRVGNAGAMAMGAVANPRYVFATASTATDYRGIAPLRYELVGELGRHDDERELVTLAADFGPGGIIGQMYELILAEQGEDPGAHASGAAGLGPSVVAALRRFHDDEALSTGPLAAEEGSVAERADAVRGLVRAAVDAAFGPSPSDQRLRQAIVRAYLDPAGGHGVAQRELHMSRSSFYRHLQRARDRLLDAC
ncbi:MAG: ATP-binding protein [Acidimicrobiales bacterium]|nr:ATP-binding protein [Acidimicrobiales bacterium]